MFVQGNEIDAQVEAFGILPRDALNCLFTGFARVKALPHEFD